MGCNNESDEDAIRAATSRALVGELSSSRVDEIAAVIGGLAVDERAKSQLRGALNPIFGDVAEDLAAVYLSNRGSSVVADQGGRGKPQGIDLVAFDPDSNQVELVEVKSTVASSSDRPRISKGQASVGWFADRTAVLGLESLGAEQITGQNVSRIAVQVNYVTGTITEWDLDEAGRPIDGSNKPSVPIAPLIKHVLATKSGE